MCGPEDHHEADSDLPDLTWEWGHNDTHTDHPYHHHVDDDDDDVDGHIQIWTTATTRHYYRPIYNLVRVGVGGMLRWMRRTTPRPERYDPPGWYRTQRTVLSVVTSFAIHSNRWVASVSVSVWVSSEW